MEKEQVFKSILAGTAILITGSGAHMSVMTPDGEEFPSGYMLSKELYRLCGIENPDDPWDLQDASDTYLDKFSSDKLVETIKNLLTVGTIQQEQKELYSCNWQRIYTTNYDEVPRNSTRKNERPLKPVTLSVSVRENILDENLCIYLNGYIEKLTPETLDNEFKLTGRSYVVDSLGKSEWNVVMSEDLETADCVVIVGLSLDYDFDIKRLICNQKIVDKTVFIVSSDIKDNLKRKMERMGTVYPIGLQTFVEELLAYKKKYGSQPTFTSSTTYKSFQLYRPEKTVQSASALEVYDLVMRGELCTNLWYRKNGKYNNIVFRKKLKEVKEYIESGCRVIYLHANLGNGKTMFIEELKHQLKNKEISVYTFLEYYQGITAKEIKQIVEESGRKLIIIENYYNYLSVIKHFSMYSLKNVQFLLSARTVLYDTRITEVADYLNIGAGDSIAIDINKLERGELNELEKIFTTNGLWGQNMNLSNNAKRNLLEDRNKGNREMQGIMLGVLNSTSMKQRIERVVTQIKKMSVEYYEVLILALLIKVMSLNIKASDMSKILNMRIALDTNFINNENVREILDFSSGEAEFRLKSAVTANAILRELDCNETILKVLSLTAQYADRYHNYEKYENALKNIISYSHVNTFLMKSGQREQFLIDYYDQLKELEYYKKNSFYWLQYSIACMNVERYDLAQIYLDAAYSWFRESDIVVPFQLDTQQARLNLIMIEKRRTDDVKAKFLQAHEMLMKPVVSNKDNPVKQIRNFYYYIKKSVKSQMRYVGASKEYQICCGEAYNKINDFLKGHSIDIRGEQFENLMKKLLMYSAEQ